MTAYYNENDPFAAAWLRELITHGFIAPGHVDERSIEDVTPNDLRGYTQHHFFAGIGGWSYALRLAGWPDSRPVWTGSCPCQPFSLAGKGVGFADKRHLWPAWHWLIQQCRPDIIFGEQVADCGPWIDLVSADLEAQSYAFGKTVLGAHSFGGFHIRRRLYWVADSGRPGLEIKCQQQTRIEFPTLERSGAVDLTDGTRRPIEPGTFPLADGVPGRMGLLRGYGNAIVPQVAAEFIKAFAEIKRGA